MSETNYTTAKTDKKMMLYAQPDMDLLRCRALADKLGIDLTDDRENAEQADLFLQMDTDGLALTDGKLLMRGDLTSMLPRLKQGRLQGELLVKASKIKGSGDHPIAVDATAGMGEDSLLLAAAGYHVFLFEKDPVIAALLDDSLRRALEVPELAPIVERMHLTDGDSIEAFSRMEESPDLIYLDPMFPARSKSGLIKKKFQLLQQLERPCSDEQELLQAAIDAHPKRIVIKRPLKGPFLAGMKPSYSITGKAIRYDCLVI